MDLQRYNRCNTIKPLPEYESNRRGIRFKACKLCLVSHLLLFLHSDDQFLTTDKIDEVVCAELPAQETQPELYEIVTTTMSHGPCGIDNPQAPCMISKYTGAIPYCSKRFPRGFQSETAIQSDGYPLYRRRDNGIQHVHYNAQGGIVRTFDNRSVVPYNPYLTRRYTVEPLY